MPDITPNLGIKKPLGNENVSRASFNENWDILDANAAPKNKAQMVKLTQDDGTRVVTNATDITTLSQGFYTLTTQFTTPAMPVANDTSWYALDVSYGNGMKQFCLRRNFDNRLWLGSVHTDGSFRGWDEVITSKAPTWTNATLQNGWVSYDATRILKYRKDEKGFVEFDGYVKSGTVATDVGIFTLPTGYRPAGIDQSPIAVSGGFAQIRINSTGVVSIESSSVTSGGSPQGWTHAKARFYAGN